MCFLQPAFQLRQDRQTLFLPTDKALFIAHVFEFTLDTVQLVDHRQGYIDTSSLALGLHFLRFDELASNVR